MSKQVMHFYLPVEVVARLKKDASQLGITQTKLASDLIVNMYNIIDNGKEI